MTIQKSLQIRITKITLKKQKILEITFKIGVNKIVDYIFFTNKMQVNAENISWRGTAIEEMSEGFDVFDLKVNFP